MISKQWKLMHFMDCIEKVKAPSKIQKKKYLSEGKYPIISQDNSTISGYWNNSDDLYAVEKSVVVFGDHTCALKFIDFDFVVGADGVKILKTKDFLNAKFFFYQLLSFNLQSTGYARHFRKLKEHMISIPPLEEQQRIVSILDEAFKKFSELDIGMIKKQQLLETLLNSTIENYIGSEHNWEEKPISEICQEKFPVVYGILQPGPILTDGIPYIRPTEIVNGQIQLDKIRKTSNEIASKYERSKILGGDIILTIVGTIGKVAIVPDSLSGGNITQSSVRIRPNSEVMNNEFLNFLLLSPLMKRRYEQKRTGTAVTRLNVAHVRELLVPIPPIREQLEIVNKLTTLLDYGESLTIDHSTGIESINELKKTILQEAFNGNLTREITA